MKKFVRIFAAIATITSLTLTPLAVQAQVEPVDPSTDPTVPAQEAPLPETGAPAQAPDTGIAPSNRVAQTIAVFAGGSLLGAGIGLGIISLRKKQSE